MKTEEKVIDLEKYTKDGVYVLSGKEKGENMRAKLHLDSFEGTVTFKVPSYLKFITTSYLLGLLSKSVIKYGEAEFRRNHKFVGKNLGRTIEDVIEETKKTGNPLR